MTVQADRADHAFDAERATLMVLGDFLPLDETKRQQFTNRLGIPVALRTRHFVNVTPLENGSVIPFNELQDRAEGIHRLGVLRLDVDDLGTLFGNGFRKRGGLVPTVALSWALSMFFEGWVGQLAEAASGTRQVVYSIYSGGDDLFIVGAWDVLPHLARSITRDLQRYSVENPLVHASAGITLHGGKYPMYQMARAAADALEQAKSYERDGQRKNAFTFLGRTFSWHDYETLIEEFQKLQKLSQQKSILHLLRRFEYLYRRHRYKQLSLGRAPKQVYWGPWHWQSAYFLTRLADQNRNHRNELLAVRDRLADERFHYIEILGFAARWVELYTRTSRKE
jgi:CRISPR-associated protein Csm1